MALTIAEIKAANKAAGYHFFDQSTMRYFGSRVLGPVYGGRYFVTSERDSGPGQRVWGGLRRYTVRRLEDSGAISTPSGFGDFGSPEAARREARRLALADNLEPSAAD